MVRPFFPTYGDSGEISPIIPTNAVSHFGVSGWKTRQFGQRRLRARLLAAPKAAVKLRRVRGSSSRCLVFVGLLEWLASWAGLRGIAAPAGLPMQVRSPEEALHLGRALSIAERSRPAFLRLSFVALLA